MSKLSINGPTGPNPVVADTDDRLVAGQPKSAADAAWMVRYDRLSRLPIILAAVLPLILIPQPGHWIDEAIDVISWLVFVVDFVVHRRRLHDYLGTRLGRFDLGVVILTAPWFLISGAHGGSVVVFLRLARLVRLVIASRGARRLITRLGRVAAVAGGVVTVGALVAYYAEHATNPGFKTYRDSLWWATVTLTTVGYGDIVPETSAGRWAAVVIMLTGVAVLGLLAGSLASFFRLGSDDDEAAEADRQAAPQQAVQQPEDRLADLTAELQSLRAEMALLSQRLSAWPPTSPAGTDSPPVS